MTLLAKEPECAALRMSSLQQRSPLHVRSFATANWVAVVDDSPNPPALT